MVELAVGQKWICSRFPYMSRTIIYINGPDIVFECRNGNFLSHSRMLPIDKFLEGSELVED